ncbi:MAG: TonB-dependent siderophore receptor [Rhodospirillaceae bacterium]|nr:TonB-dependent siderophore receptor [Rhodospirillaceae bacterium]
MATFVRAQSFLRDISTDRLGGFGNGFSAALLLATALSSATVTVARAEDADADADSKLEEVVVTGLKDKRAAGGTKTDTPLIEIPQSISVISAEQMDLRGALTVSDILLYTAGVRSEAFGLDSRVDSYNVRGATPAQYLDGMRMIYGSYNTARVDPYALDRVEVLRGPSSVLYGQGTIGGLVNLASKRPTFEARNEVTASYGTHNRAQVQGDVTGLLNAEGTFAYRIVGSFRNADTQVDNVNDDRWFIAPSISYRPSSDTEFTLSVHHQRDDMGLTGQFFPLIGTLDVSKYVTIYNAANPNGIKPLANNVNGLIPYNTYVGEPDFDNYNSRQTNVTTSVNHKFNDWLQFRHNARFSDSFVVYKSIYTNFSGLGVKTPYYTSQAAVNAATATAVPGSAPVTYTGPDRIAPRTFYTSYPKVRNYATDNSVQADFATGALAHTLLAGFDAQDYTQDQTQDTGVAAPVDIFAPRVFNSAANRTYRYTAFNVQLATVKQNQMGVYAQDQISYGGLDLILGLRRDWAESKSITPAGVVTEKDDSKTTMRAGLVYNIGGIAPYVSYAESFLPVAGANLAGEPFKPQVGEQIEAGVKWQPNPAVLVTAAYFDIKDTNRLTLSPTNPNDRVQTGEVSSEGFELEAQANLFEFYNLSASYAYTDAYISDSNNRNEIGKPFSSVAKHVFTSFLTRKFIVNGDDVFTIGAGLRYTGRSVDRTAPLPTAAAPNPEIIRVVTPAILLGDMIASYEWDEAWRVQVNANNITDEKYPSACLSRGDCFLGQRRTVIASVRHRF